MHAQRSRSPRSGFAAARAFYDNTTPSPRTFHFRSNALADLVISAHVPRIDSAADFGTRRSNYLRTPLFPTSPDIRAEISGPPYIRRPIALVRRLLFTGHAPYKYRNPNTRDGSTPVDFECALTFPRVHLWSSHVDGFRSPAPYVNPVPSVFVIFRPFRGFPVFPFRCFPTIFQFDETRPKQR